MVEGEELMEGGRQGVFSGRGCRQVQVRQAELLCPSYRRKFVNSLVHSSFFLVVIGAGFLGVHFVFNRLNSCPLDAWYLVSGVWCLVSGVWCPSLAGGMVPHVQVADLCEL